MRRLVQARLLLTLASGLGASAAAQQAAPPAEPAPATQADDAAKRRVDELVLLLAAPTREQRLSAQGELMSLVGDAALQMDRAAPPPGFEARAALEYVRAHRPAPVKQIAVPAGKYRVGSAIARDRNPEREVSLESFRIDDAEVTCFEYWRFTRATKTPAPPNWSGGRYPYGGERLPVGNVSSDEAGRFAEWVGGRLPKTDEWEVAATGGTGHPFPWNESTFPRLANFNGELVEVRSEPQDRSPLGGFDFCASLREWVVLTDGTVAPRGGWINSGQFLYLRLTRAADETWRERRPYVGLRVCDRTK
jgi:formylglycine-generating enzyme required for sulfatase activity